MAQLSNIMSWNDGTYTRMFQDIVEDRAWDRFSVLADVLEDAGGENSAFLRDGRAARLMELGYTIKELNKRHEHDLAEANRTLASRVTALQEVDCIFAGLLKPEYSAGHYFPWQYPSTFTLLHHDGDFDRFFRWLDKIELPVLHVGTQGVNPNVNDLFLAKLAERIPGLDKLSLSELGSISDEGLRTSLPKFRNLTKLHIGNRFANPVSQEVILDIVRAGELPHLEEVYYPPLVDRDAVTLDKDTLAEARAEGDRQSEEAEALAKLGIQERKTGRGRGKGESKQT